MLNEDYAIVKKTTLYPSQLRCQQNWNHKYRTGNLKSSFKYISDNLLVHAILMIIALIQLD